ncbi:dockerin type I domain-containing protein [Botrimarina sp.]|uniref:beta strand repeat-containing protein n=1 Tax=Botrimarina sp. TaxID=2795802 RepID=UPI0032EB6885
MRSLHKSTCLRMFWWAAAISFATAHAPTKATDFVWNPGVALGDFDDPNSWFAATSAPTVGDTVTFEDAARANFTIDGAVDTVTVVQNVGFVFQSDTGVRTLTVDDVVLEDSSSLLLEEVRLALSGSVTGTSFEDAKLELLEQARVTGGVIDGVQVLLSDASALLNGVELRNSLVMRSETVESSILNDISIGSNVTLAGNSGAMLQLDGATSFVGDSGLAISPSLVAVLNGPLMGAGNSQQITNFGELRTATLANPIISFDDAPGVSQSLTINNSSGVLNIQSLSSLVVSEGGLVVEGGSIEGGGTLRADGADLIVNGAAVIDGVSVQAFNGASLSLGASLTLQSADVEVSSGSASDIPSGFAIGAGSAYRSTNGGIVTIGPAITNDGVLRAERATLRVVGDTILNGAGTTALDSAGGLGVAPRIELPGGGSLTVGADQTLFFDTPDDGYLYGTGSGGLALVNEGLLRVGVNGRATVLQSDNAASPIAAATLQDFTLENRSELVLDSGSRLTLLNDSSTASTPVTAVDNVGGVITLNARAELVFDQPNFTSAVVLQGGLITGDGAVRSSGGNLLINGAAVIDGATIAVEDGALLTLGAEVTLQSADIAIGQQSTYALSDGFMVDAGMTYRSYSGGLLTIDGEVTNNGLVRADGAMLRFLGDATLSGTGTTEAVTEAGNGPVFMELAGGGSLTVGVDQSLLFDSPNVNFLYGSGSGGVTLVNDGLIQVGIFDDFYVTQFDNGGIPDATLQDFTLVNNGELLLKNDSEMVFFANLVDSTTPVTTTIDNRNGLITLEAASELRFEQSGFPADVTLRGGQIVGPSTDFDQVVVAQGASLRLTDSPTFTDTTLRVEPGATLTIDGEVTNNGLVRADGAMLRFLGDAILNGSGVTESRGVDPRIEIDGGASLTVGMDQTLLLGEFAESFVYGSGSGGVTLVNDGLVRLGQFATTTVFQTDNPLSPVGGATWQDFTLVNNGELMLRNDSRLVFRTEETDSPTPVTTTIDNRNGVITLEAASELRFEQSGLPADVTLRGGQIVGPSTDFDQVVVAQGASLRLTDSPTFTDTTLRVEEGGTLTIEGPFTYDAFAVFRGARLNAVGGEWLGSGDVVFEEASPSLPAQIVSSTGAAIRFGAGKQVRISSGVTTLSDATIAGSTTDGAGSLTVEPGATLRVETAAAGIDDVAFQVLGVLDARADLVATVPIPVAAGGELRVDAAATVSAPNVTIDPGGVLTLAGGVLDTPTFELNGAAVGDGTIITPNDPATPTQISAPITGTSPAMPIALTGWIEGGGLLDNVLIEGTHSPGDGIAFTDAGSIAYGPTADLLIEITNQNVLNPGFDRVVATGSVTLDGDLDLQLVDYVENTLSINDQLVLLTSGGLSGQFANVAPGDRVLFDGGLASAQIDYGATSPFDPNHIVFSEFVREPQQVFWIGGNSNWNSLLNWDLLRIPNNDGPLKFHAIINAGTVDVDVPVTLSRLTLNNAGSALTLNQTVVVEDLFWNAGNLTGPNVLTTTGESTIDTDGQVDTGPGLVNQGTATWVDGNVVGQFAGQGFVNEGEFLIELTEDHSFWYVTNIATGVIRHTGTARATLGPNTGFENDGLVEITGGGTLRVARDRNNGSDGDFVIANGVFESAVGFGADHKFNGSVTGQEFRSLTGTISFNGAYDVDTTSIAASVVTFNTPSPATTDTLTIHSGDLKVETMLIVDQLNWNGGGFVNAAGQTTLTTSAVVDTPAQKKLTGQFVNQGEVTWRDGDFSQSSQGLFRNEGTLLIELAAERSLYHALNTSTGVIRHTTAARAILGPTAGFENDGLVEITGGGTLRVARDRNNGSDGDFVITDGVLESAVGFGADHKLNGSVTGQEFRSLTGTISLNGAYDVDTTTVNGGLVTFNTPSPATTDTLAISAGEVHVATEFVFDQITWTGGGFGNSAGQPVLTGQGVISGPAVKAVGTTLVNRGALTWNDGAVGTGSVTAARVRNEGLLTIDLVAPRNIVRLENSPGGVVQNNGAAATIDRIANDGTIDVAASSVTLVGTVDNHSGTTLNGGEWIVRDGATLDFGAKTITVNNAAVRLFGPASTFAAIGPLDDNRGVFEIAEGRDFTTVGDLANSGSLVIGAGGTLTVSGVYTQTGAGSSLQVDGEFLSPSGPATFAGGAALGGGGFVPGDVVIGADGVVSPGASPGTLTVERLLLEDGAVYEWEFDGAESDSIVTTDTLWMPSTATLRVVQLGGSPSLTDEFVLFEYPSTQVDPTNPVWAIDGTGAPDWDLTSAVVSIDTTKNQVLLTGVASVFNAADYNNDGAVDAADYSVWRDNLDEQVTPFTSADGDGDGRVSSSDYLAWTANFGTLGVPADSTAVPEPEGIAVVGLICLINALRQRPAHQVR